MKIVRQRAQQAPDAASDKPATQSCWLLNHHKRMAIPEIDNPKMPQSPNPSEMN